MRYNQITIVCPYYETGGPEALHQLCGVINDQGGNAFIWYYGENKECHPAYSGYNVKVTTSLRDEVGCAVVLPECEGKMVHQIQKAQLFFWWLSVDNNNFLNYGNSFQNDKITHLYQSNYALHYLWTNGAMKYLPLYDFINDDYMNTKILFKEDIICYNPRKGFETTSKIINDNPNLTFVPLTGMSRQQVKQTLSTSKVYIDFGYHPGKDRFPREAAMLNNIIISGWEGSSMFYNDMPISNDYKFDNKLYHLDAMLLNCICAFEKHINEMQTYRSVIVQQKEEFINQTKQIFL